MPKILILLTVFLLFVPSVLSASQCSQIQNADTEQIWQIMKLSNFDKIFLLTAGTLSVIVLILGILSWASYKSFSTPSDIMFAIVISQFIQNTALVIQAGYFMSSDSSQAKPSNFDYYCVGMGIINIIGNVYSIYYNLIFCVLLSYSIRNTLKRSIFSRFRYHILSFIITGGVTLTLVLTDSIGRSLNGICGFKVASRQSTARFILQILIAIICIYSMIKFRQKFPQNEYFKKQLVFGFYFYYMGIFALTQIVSSIFYLISDIICRAQSSDIVPNLHVFYSVSICVNILLSYAIVFLRFNHPILMSKFLKFIKNKDKLNQSQKQIIQFEMSEEQHTDQQNTSWLGGLFQSLKGSQILSFIQGITIAFIQKERKYYSGGPTALAYQRHYTFQVNQEIVENFIQNRISSRQSLIVKKRLQGLSGLPYQVTSYCPELFSQQFSKKELRQIIKSLDLKKNIKVVKKQSNINGGKSGQLFFGTYDNQLLFKTVTEDEINAYLSKIKLFSQYFKKQKHSLLVKLLGVFRFQRKDIKQEPIFIILMYNITRQQKQRNIRVYDIKGSQFNRSTMQDINMKSKEQKDQKLRKYTLKDNDFKVLQNKIKIHQNYAKDLKKILRKDVQFLGSLGFMDYSLLIIKRQGQPSQKSSGFSQMMSNQQEGVIYNFGIIDYLQSWTIKRKAQRVLKTLITKRQVTANSPINYSSRLTQFIDTIL